MSNLRYLFTLISLTFITAFASAADSVVGDWKTIDDVTGKTKSIVRISKTDHGDYEGQVIEILHSDRGPNPLCDDCPGELRGKPVKGLVILWGLKDAKENNWKGGEIIDPKNGKIYKAKLHLREDGKLEVRGFIGISLLGRTQVWEPAG